MNINEKILLLRKKAGVSQEILAEKLNVTRQTISNWELGQTTPDILQAKALSEFFKISLDDLTDNKLEFELKDNTNNIMQKLIGKNCCLIMDEDYTDSYINGNSKVIDVSNGFIKIEYKRGNQVLNKLIEVDSIIAIRVIEEASK